MHKRIGSRLLAAHRLYELGRTRSRNAERLSLVRQLLEASRAMTRHPETCGGITHMASLSAARSKGATNNMPRSGVITLGDLKGKLDVLHIACRVCARAGKYKSPS
jgi:hypothetical protein